jgi:phosphopantetheinyl transferase
MILFKTQIFPSISIGVWQIIETEDFFWNLLHLSVDDEAKITSIKLQQIRLQKLACRAVLAELLGSPKIGITYLENGQPQLKKHHISFAHTNNCVAVTLGATPTGIDIEELTPRILPLYSRFMNSREIAECDVTNVNVKALYYYWCAKEAMYKWAATENLNFIEDLFVDKINRKGIVCNKHVLNLADFTIENKLIVVCYE